MTAPDITDIEAEIGRLRAEREALNIEVERLRRKARELSPVIFDLEEQVRILKIAEKKARRLRPQPRFQGGGRKA